MIEINITHSQEFNKVGLYQFYFDEVSLGSHMDNQCFLPHDEILEHHLSLKIDKNQLILVPHEEVEFYHVNGKKTKGQKVLKNKDKIKIGTAALEIQSFSPEVKFPKNEFLNNRVDQLQKENSPLLNVLQNMDSNEEEL